MSQRRDTDYLAISARIHAMETRLLTRERMERMIEAKEDGDATKILTECGYGELTQLNLAELETLIASNRAELFRDMKNAVSDLATVEIFQLQYDYHNAKVLIKSQKNGKDPRPLLVGGGRYHSETLLASFARDELGDVTSQFKLAMLEAKETLAETNDPQLVDFVLDRAWYSEMEQLAKSTENEFLMGYVRLLADGANLRSAVRCLRMGKGGDFLKLALVSGGNVSTSSIVAVRGAEISNIFAGHFAEAARVGEGLIAKGGTFTQFERLCDDTILRYLTTAKRIPFGIQTVVGYLYARQAELTAIRTILSGRLAGLDRDIVRSRLRMSYE